MAVLLASPIFITSYKTVWFFNRGNKTDPEKLVMIKLGSTNGWIKNTAKAPGLDCWCTRKDTERMEANQ